MVESIREREILYKLIISQLRYDGLDMVAANLAKCVGLETTPMSPSSRLLGVMKLGLQEEKNGLMPEMNVAPGLAPQVPPAHGLDLEYETEDFGTSPPMSQYETHYVTAHKGPCTAAAFSHDGRLISTGSNDASIKIIDVDRMLAKAAQSHAERQAEKESDDGAGMKNHPVIRTMYDHEMTVTYLEFHPSVPVLVSGSEDRTVKLFDFSKSSVKKAYKTIEEAETIRGISFHPAGDYILVATDSPTVRLYDVKTFQCFVSNNPRDQHTGPLTSVKYAPGAHLYATSSKDGSFKIWDGVSNRCVNTFKNAHGGAEVMSARFTKNSKYVLTSGKDSCSRLWELSTGRTLNIYVGTNINQGCSTPSIFNHTEDYVMFPDDKNMSIGCWDSRTTEKLKTLPSGHNNYIRFMVHSPVESAMMTCSEDYRARFWYCKGSG